jgi:hypothetical protein
MSMLLIARDTAALIDLEKGLQVLRETQLRAARSGRIMSASELQAAEAAVVEAIKQQYFCELGRLAFMPAAEADAVTDEEDYQRRQHVDTESAILAAHRRILSLPCVGAPGHDDPEPTMATAERP